MADNTLLAVLGIVLITLVTAVFFATQTNNQTENIAGSAIKPPAAQQGCEPGRYCDGTKLVIIRDDCTLATAWCQYGCDPAALVCR